VKYLIAQSFASVIPVLFVITIFWLFQVLFIHFTEFNTINDLIYMSGCDNTIHKGEDGNFYSKNGGSNCGGSYNGATYTTSEFRLYKNMIVSWERGWKADGTQAWGSHRGFYYFRKISTHIF
jgi:hypothetical protein